MIKIIAFDVFGTVFNLDDAEHTDVKEYVSQVKSEEWKPLELPSSWKTLSAHEDAAEGIHRLRQKYIVVTMSNCPVELMVELSRNNFIDWDMIIPIEMNHVYKPKLDAYRCIRQLFPSVDTSEMLMVTANPTFGDIEAAQELWMKPQVIRQEGCPRDIIELAVHLGA